MPNAYATLAIDDVKTHADEVHFLTQECVTAGLATTFYTYVAGLVTIPLTLKAIRIPVPTEYKFFTGAMLSMIISYYAGVNAKKKCEEDLKKQLAEKLRS